MTTIQKVEAGIKERLEKIGLSYPEELTLTITSLCNLRCRHCWPDCGPDVRNSHVPFGYILQVINTWQELGVSKFCITGGEPFLHPKWQKILEYCCDFDGVTAVKVQSNGVMLSKEIIEILAQPAFEKVFLQISLDGHSEEHDSIRGVGSYLKTFAALKLLKQAGLSKRTTVSYTETEKNFGQLRRILELVDELEISGLTSNTLVRGGRAVSDAALNMPTPEQYIELIKLYETDFVFRELYDRKGNIAAIEWYKSRDDMTADDTCSCMSTPYINAQGQLFPCALLPVTYLAVDDIWEKTMEDVLPEIELKWSQLHAISQKRPLWIKECSACSGRDHCKSGCLGRSLILTGDFFQTEDRCLHRKAVYQWQKH